MRALDSKMPTPTPRHCEAVELCTGNQALPTRVTRNPLYLVRVRDKPNVLNGIQTMIEGQGQEIT